MISLPNDTAFGCRSPQPFAGEGQAATHGEVWTSEGGAIMRRAPRLIMNSAPRFKAAATSPPLSTPVRPPSSPLIKPPSFRSLVSSDLVAALQSIDVFEPNALQVTSARRRRPQPHTPLTARGLRRGRSVGCLGCFVARTRSAVRRRAQERRCYSCCPSCASSSGRRPRASRAWC